MTYIRFSNPAASLVFGLALAFFAVAPLFYPGYFQTHNGLIAVWNVADLRVNWGNWQWTPQLGLQFAPFRSDGLLPYYLAAILPVEPLVAVKLVLGASLLLGHTGMLFWLRRWLGGPGALVAALIYTYLPYHLATIYVRGAWGEALFWGLLPWAIYTSEAASQPHPGANRKGYGIVIFGAGLLWLWLGLSSLGLTLWAFVFVGVILWLFYLRLAIGPLLAGFLGLIAAFLITRAVAIPPPPHPLSDHFLYPFQLFSSFWGFGPSRPGWQDGMSFQLGFAALGLALLTLFLWQGRADNSVPFPRGRWLAWLGGGALIFGLLPLDLSKPLWYLPFLPLAESLTYPWQLLGFAGLCLAVIAGAGMLPESQFTRLPLFGAVVLLVILSSYPYLAPQYVQVEPKHLAGPEATLGENQLALLAHHFSIEINPNTAGLRGNPTAVSLASHGRVKGHDVLQLNVTWQPLRIFSEDWKIFAHLVDANDQILAQFDGPPLAGDYPTSRWVPGELIQDSYPLVIPADVPPAPYRVFLGLYHEASGVRLMVPGAADKVILDVE